MSLIISAIAAMSISLGLQHHGRSLIKSNKADPNVTAGYIGVSFVLNALVFKTQSIQYWFDAVLFSVWLLFLYLIAYAAYHGITDAAKMNNKVRLEKETKEAFTMYPVFACMTLLLAHTLTSFLRWLVE